MTGSSPRQAEGQTIGRRINGERFVLAGWSRAILMQMAHPLVARGVAEHSAFKAGARVSALRLHSTVRAMLGLTFGDAVRYGQVVERIRDIHRRVHGTLAIATGPFPAGTGYSAEDPALVLWVHATLLDSTVIAFRAIVGDLAAADVDAYIAEAAPVAIDLGARPADVPRNTDSLTRYMTSMYASGQLVVGTDAKFIADAVLQGPLANLAFPAAWLNQLVTAGWLPPDLRRQYALPWPPARARRFDRALALLRAIRRISPPVVRQWPEARSRAGR